MKTLILGLALLSSPAIAGEWALVASTDTVVRGIEVRGIVVQVVVANSSIFDLYTGPLAIIKANRKVGPGWYYDGVNFVAPPAAQ